MIKQLYCIFCSYTAILCFIPILISIVSLMDPRLILHVYYACKYSHLKCYSCYKLKQYKKLTFIFSRSRQILHFKWLLSVTTCFNTLTRAIKMNSPAMENTLMYGGIQETLLSPFWSLLLTDTRSMLCFWNILRFICMDLNF